MPQIGQIRSAKHSMNAQRKMEYESLFSRVGNTSLYKIRHIEVPNGNRVYAKEEYRSPTGSHYDRVYPYLLYEAESDGLIAPDTTTVVENSSGNAGAAVAWACRELGYQCLVVLPGELPASRIRSVSQYQCDVRLAEAGEGVRGTQKELSHILTKERVAPNGTRYWCPDHSRNEVTLKALARIADEVTAALPVTAKIDYFIAAVGNGSTILGPSLALRKSFPDLKVVCWEPLPSPHAFSIRYPRRYRELFGIAPGALRGHSLYGTGVMDIAFPFLNRSLEERPHGRPLVDDVVLVSDSEIGYRYVDLLKSIPGDHERFLRELRSLPLWDAEIANLHAVEGKPIGHSSVASFAVARMLAEAVKERTFLLIFYDPIWKY